MIDMKTLKAGDTIVLRSGVGMTVEAGGAILDEENTTWDNNGKCLNPHLGDEMDIVEIIPKEDDGFITVYPPLDKNKGP